MCDEQGTKTAWQWSQGCNGGPVACFLNLFHSFLLGSCLTQPRGVKSELKVTQLYF